MKTKYWVVLVLALYLFSAVSPALADPTAPEGGRYGKKYITEKTDDKSIRDLVARGCTVDTLRRVASVQCPDAVASEMGLEEDIKVFALGIGSDAQIGADKVWSMGYTGANRLVAVIDTGMDYTNPELSSSYAGGYDFANKDANPIDDNGHGTHVAGIITADGIDPNAKGAAPGTKILALKALDANGGGYLSDVISAIYYAVDGPDGVSGTADDFHPDALSMSLGTSSPYIYSGANCDTAYPSMTNAVNYAVEHGVAAVAAAGNYARNTQYGVSIPGCISSAIAVAAVDAGNARPWWSGQGNSLDISAPGVSIYSAWPSGYATLSGTSMATPYVSAVVALLKQANPNLTVAGVKSALYNTAKDLGTTGWDANYGWGLVNATSAVLYVLPKAPAAPVHDVAVTSVSAPSSATKGSVVTITVALANEGNQPESFTVTATDDTDSVAIGSKSVSMNAGTTQAVSFSFNTASSSVSTHMIRASASVVAGETDTLDNSKTTAIAIALPPAQLKMHIASVDVAAESNTYSRVRGAATVTIVDASGAPVAGANVSGHWSGLASDVDRGTTDSLGKIKVYSDWRRRVTGTFTFTIDSVAKSGWVYDTSANAATSGSVNVAFQTR